MAGRSALRFRYPVFDFTAQKESVILLRAALASLERNTARCMFFPHGPLAASQSNSFHGSEWLHPRGARRERA